MAAKRQFMNDHNSAQKKLILLENAKDSLSHAVDHLTHHQPIEITNIKRAILDSVHCLELLFKEKLQRIHPAFILENIDVFGLQSAKTVSISRAMDRLCRLTNISLDKKLIKECIQYRNDITHFEFKITTQKANVLLGRVISFLFLFSKNELQLDWADEFKNNPVQWLKLVELRDFWNCHGKALEEQLSRTKKIIVECFFCKRKTFDTTSNTCALCGHNDQKITCDRCGKAIWKGQGIATEEIIGGIEIEPGVFPSKDIIICPRCRDDEFLDYLVQEEIDSIRGK